MVRSILDYHPEAGVLTWRKRDPSMFENDVVRCAQWNTKYAGKPTGRKRGRAVIITIFGRPYRVHRIAWLYMTGEVAVEIDHINHDVTDNRWANLREVTRSQNNMNRGKHRRNATGFKGVTHSNPRGKFVARIQANGEVIRLGTFSSPEEAHAAYCSAAGELHGEFACYG
jgi:hypothetical protein